MHEQDKPRLAGLAETVKTVIAQSGVEAVERHMLRVYTSLRLTDQNGEWTGPPDASIQAPPFDGPLSAAYIDQFIDNIVLANEQNLYLMDVYGALKNQNIEPVISEMGLTSARIIPEIVAFALVLQSLSAAFYRDTDLVARLLTHWGDEMKKIGLQRQLGVGFRIKFESIRTPIRRSRECVLAGEVPARFCNFILPFNIIQASVYDLARGQFGNARAGFVLARHRPGNKPDLSTGAGPVHFVENGQIIESGLPLAQHWVDLYQSWNLVFGAQFDTFPFYLCKLIIPQVASYQANPQQYVWNRTHALMTYLYFTAFATFDHKQGQAHDSLFHAKVWPSFSTTGLHRWWGDINHASARDYASRVRAARNEGS